MRAVALLVMFAAGVVVAAWGTHGLRPPDFDIHAATGIHAVSAIVLGGLILLAIPTMSSATLSPEYRRRIGPRQVLAGLPGLFIAWTYIIAVMAPVLIGSHNVNLLVYGLGVEGLAAYSAVFIAGWGLPDTRKTQELRIVSWLVILVTLVIVGGMSLKAGSFLLFFGYFALTVKRLATGWLNPGPSTASMREHQMMLSSATLCMYFFIGLPLLIKFDEEVLPIFGAFYFAAMAVFEMLMAAPLAGNGATARGRAPA